MSKISFREHLSRIKIWTSTQWFQDRRSPQPYLPPVPASNMASTAEHEARSQAHRTLQFLDAGAGFRFLGDSETHAGDFPT